MGGMFEGKDETTPEGRMGVLEKKVNSLLEESIVSCYRREMALALEKGKEAYSKERSLSKQKEGELGMETGVSVNTDLTFAVMFNLAIQYTKNGMYSEALNMYTGILKNRSFANSSRMKLNIGHIHSLQGHYAKAVKFYRMALDQIPTTQKETRMKIMKNIGLTFVRMNQFTDAITSFEYIMSEKADFRTGLHLLLCHFALGDGESMKKGFRKMLQMKRKESSLEVGVEGEEKSHMVDEVIRKDELRRIQREVEEEEEWSLLMSGKLIAPVVGGSFIQGYEWTVEEIRSAGFLHLANELEMHRAVRHLKKRELKEAIETLKRFERKDSRTASTAATNLSFLYFVQKDLVQAEKHADEAINADHLNSGALVNKGNCCYTQHEYERAFDYYNEALANDSACVEALFNLLLTCKKISSHHLALDAGYRLNAIAKNHIYTLYQMASTYELVNDRDQAMDWYSKLLVFIPSDPALLNKLSDLADAERDRQTAFTYLTEVRLLSNLLRSLG